MDRVSFFYDIMVLIIQNREDTSTIYSFNKTFTNSVT